MKAFSSVSRLGQSAARNAAQAVAFSIFLLACLPLFAQTNQGTIQGGVYDQSGGAIVGATVDVVDVARGIARAFTTTGAGQYVAANLTPGTYVVKAQASGFQILQRENILVEVGKTVRVDLTLQPGAQTQTVTVTSEAPQIDTSDAVLGGTLSNKEINALPLNGRNFLKLLDLRPGSVFEMGGTEGNGTANNTSFNGLRPQDNLFLFEGLPQFSPDGQPIVNQSLGGPGSILSIDAIQEFNIELNPKAEYGWKDAGVVDIGIKSGTNELHGTAFAFGRDGAWDASNFFAGSSPVELEQYGGTLGGRIIKNKIFWFVDYEAQRYSVGNGAVVTMPSDVSLGGGAKNSGLSMVDACNAVGRANVSALSARLAGLPAGSCVPQAASSSFENLFPFINAPTTNFNPSLSNSSSNNGGVVKGDYQINNHHHVDATYYISRQASTNYATTIVAPQWGESDPVNVSMASGSWAWTPNSRWVNEFRGGYATIYSPRSGLDDNLFPNNPWPNGYGLNTGVQLENNKLYGGLPVIDIGGFSGQLGANAFGGIRGPEGNIDFLDHVSYLHGNHAFKFGLDYMFQVFKGDTYKNAQGTIKFANLQSFLQGVPQSGSILVGDPSQQAGSSAYGVFFQDDWRVTQRLTLNLGMRWEYYTPPTEANNYIGNFYPNVDAATTPAIQQSGGPFKPLYSGQWKQFSPRIGTAWDLRGNGKTVVRAAIGLLYNIDVIGDNIDTAPFGANFPSIGVNTSGTPANLHTPDPFSATGAQLQAGWNLNGPVFPVTAPTTFNGVTYTGVTCLPSSPCSTLAVDRNLQTPRTLEWNVDVQRAITNNLTVDVAYVGNHEFDGLSRYNINEPPLGTGWNTPSNQLGGSTPAAFCLASATDSTPYDGCGYLGSKTAVNKVLGAMGAIESAAATYPQFPYLNYITFQSNAWYSDYEALQITASQRASHGLTFIAAYTHDSSKNFTSSGGWGGPYSQDFRQLSLDYGPSALDLINHFTFSTTYDVPAFKAPAQLLKGWVLNGIVTMQGGVPWYSQDMRSDIEGTGQFNDPNSPASQFWNYSGPPSAFRSGPATVPCFGNLPGCTPYAASGPPSQCVTAAQAPYGSNAQLQGLALAALNSLGCYVKGAGVLTPPAFGTVGNANRGLFHSPPFYNVDFSISKDTKLGERITAQFRAEFFNLFNRVDLAAPFKNSLDPERGATGLFGCSCFTPDVAAGDPVLGAGGARAIQLGLKFIF